jgi:predicted thioesterase
MATKKKKLCAGQMTGTAGRVKRNRELNRERHSLRVEGRSLCEDNTCLRKKGELHMKKMIAIALLSGVIASPAWALFETNKQLVSTATVTLEDAVKHALKVVPGKAVEAEIGKEDGRTVYEVEIIDSNNKTQKVYVDAQSGQAKIDR